MISLSWLNCLAYYDHSLAVGRALSSTLLIFSIIGRLLRFHVVYYEKICNFKGVGVVDDGRRHACYSFACFVNTQA